MAAPADVDAYIAALSEEVRPIAEAIRRTIRAAAPACGEKISYGIPAFVIDGRNFLYFAMWKKHVGLYPIGATRPMRRRSLPIARRPTRCSSC
jgi:uncharacterized protein YdhG (YjbR/CyaY superfamily)